jgi:FKBP-type peptidyl-prolyl cis-trans isomerase 2
VVERLRVFATSVFLFVVREMRASLSAPRRNRKSRFQMIVVQAGDRVWVHYVLRFEDGKVKSSREGAPLELVAGKKHRRFPGLGSALVGLTEGDQVRLHVPPEKAYGLPDSTRRRRLDRRCFRPFQRLTVGKWVRPADGSRPVRILEIKGIEVIVDTNHPRAGQSVEMELELITILSEGTPDGSQSKNGSLKKPKLRPTNGRPRPATAPAGADVRPGPNIAAAFDVDAASLASLQQALPGWQVDPIDGATTDALERDWRPPLASLLIVTIQEDVSDALALCRGLRSQVGRAATPLLALVPPDRPELINAALAAGATSCLVLPIHAQEVAHMLSQATQDRQPGLPAVENGG